MNTAFPEASAPPASERWLTVVALSCVGVLAIALGWVEIFSPDIGFHLNTGRWILEHHTLPSQNPFLYTASLPYIDLYWVYQICLWLLYSLGGSSALVTSNIVVTLLCLMVVAGRSWKREGKISVALAPILALWVFGNYWEIRPHTVSWLWLGVILLILESYRRSPGRIIWLLPVVMVAWVNCHSLFILGLVAIGIYAADAMFDRASRSDRRFWIMVGLCGGVCFINPYGLSGVLYPFQQLGMLQSGSSFKSAEWGISEYQTPFKLWRYTALSGEFNLWQPIFAMHIYAVLAVTSFLVFIPKASRIEWATMALFGYTFFSAEKNFGYFFVATAPIVINRLSLLGKSFPKSATKFATIKGGLVVSGAAVVTLLLAVSQVANGRYYANLKAPFRSGSAFSGGFLPTGAAEFLRTAPIQNARILNTLDAGGYLAWQSNQKVFIDGLLETYGPVFFREYIGFKRLDTLRASLAKWSPDVVVVPYSAIPEWIYYFREKARWRLVYYDERDAVFFEPRLAPGIPAVGNPAAGEDYPVYENQAAERIVRDNVALEHRGFGERLFGRHYYPSREIRLSAFHYWCGNRGASLGMALDGLQKATEPSPDLLLNAGNAFFDLGQPASAQYCFEQFLRLDRNAGKPNDPAREQAVKRLGQISVSAVTPVGH